MLIGGLAVAMLLFTGVTPAHALSVKVNRNLIPRSGALWGAYVGNARGQRHMSAVRAFERRIGFRLSIDNQYRPWDSTTWVGEAEDLRAGRVPLISWTARGTTAARIASGADDRHLRRVARGLRALHHRVFLRFAYEMDQPRHGRRYIGPPDQFIHAWRHTYRLFHAMGALNVRFVWCPIAADFETGRAQAYYPGNHYVNWIAADGYNWYPAKRTWSQPGDIFKTWYRWASRRPRPLMIAEVGVMEDPHHPARKAAWLTRFRSWVRARPHIKAVSYFSAVSPKGYHFQVTTSHDSLRAFRRWGRDPYFHPFG